MAIETDILRRLLFWERERARELLEIMRSKPDADTERLLIWCERRVRALEAKIMESTADHDRPGYDRKA